mmetsp:Transcript_3003/g.4896  ORF Transcript_3003/g.4896 Transcript_3003/m.4896 type:complete len:260 (-) Transcript_3003:255-1034(-)|eukprot:CAMPEP_0119012550 /NCGR_PEP_ID=MMETSP1176-20130426/6910_1 /TAXON_ID=265551 /ORGANISM="Synedropsis recta cf, Strain CCMP1620" /LENGTH=259 /DNA_ID=CAMNT_0006965533 /DNA_START=160 /DNA_END=939 /DNA_ORIENTATION=+
MMRIPALLLLALCSPASAFVAPRPHQHAVGASTSMVQRHEQPAAPSALYMSSSLAKQDDRLPPPPEDQLTMSGDVAVLFLYSFLDHCVNEAYVDALQSNDMAAASGLDPLNEFGASGQLPVWYDGLHSTMLQKDQLLNVLNIPNVNYAPVLQTAGMASIAMTTCWLLSGWLQGAFLFQNTIECHTTRMLYVTGKTWLLTVTLMVLLALGSDAMLGVMDPSQQSLGGLSKADVDYIFDSLTVIVMWRFMVSSMLGGFSKK